MTTKKTVIVTRRVTETPLARLHERALLRSGSRPHKAVPFARFVRSKYPDAALTLAFEAQRALAFGEYTAVDLFAHLASSLALLGAPIDVVAAATRIPCDEVRHAELAFAMARALSGASVTIEFDPSVHTKRWARPLDMDSLDAAMIEVSAVGETLACALLSACRKRASDPVPRAVFASIVADEIHHARLGWYYLAWRAPQWTQPERQRVADRVGAMLIEVERRFWNGRDAPAEAKAAARALGVLESNGQREVVAAVMEDEIVPALDALGLGASHAWRARKRGR